MPTEISGSTGVNKIQDNTIVDADINSSAAIAGSKLVMPSGSVLQVVQTTSNTGITVSANTYRTIGSNVVITPSSASSKVLVQLTAGSMAYNAGDIAMRITRNGTEIMVQGRQAYTNSNEWVGNPVKLMYLDSPNSTSAVTYSFECKVSGNQIEFNSTGGSTSNVNGAVSIAMEIAG